VRSVRVWSAALRVDVVGASRTHVPESGHGAPPALPVRASEACWLAALAEGLEGDGGVDAEVGLGGGVDVEEVGYGGGEGVAVEDAGMAEDVHEQGVGAVAGV